MHDTKLSRYDSADFLDSEEAIAAFLDRIEGDGDGASQLGRALGVVARARMLTQLASDVGMNRHELVATLVPIFSPSIEALDIIARALGVVELLDFSRVGTSPPWRARNVIPLPGYRLAVQFQDGVSGLVDLSAVVESSEPGGFTVLREPGAFDEVYVAGGMVTWSDEVDLRHDVMHQTLKERGEWIVTADDET